MIAVKQVTVLNSSVCCVKLVATRDEALGCGVSGCLHASAILR